MATARNPNIVFRLVAITNTQLLLDIKIDTIIDNKHTFKNYISYRHGTCEKPWRYVWKRSGDYG